MSVVGSGSGVGVLGVGAGMTQTDAVLEFLRMRGPLTQPVAQEELGCLRLGARIWDLKQRGFAISTELVELASGQRVAEYSLVGSSTPAPRREGSKTRLPGSRSSTVAQGKGEAAAGSSGRGSSTLLPGREGDSSERDGSGGSSSGAASGGVSVDGSGVGLRDGVTLDVALGVFGDLVMDLGVSPTVREFGRALGVSSESVAHRWVRVLEGEGLLCVNEQLGHGAVRGWVVSAAGFERLYRVERGRRLVLEGAVRVA